MRLYYFTNRKYGLQNLRRGRLKISRINDLNDPFEFLGVASRDQAVRQRYAILKAGLANYMGMLCFSAGWRNPVQWSHYADHHRGICLGFDVKADVHRVHYSDERLKPNVRAMSRESDASRQHVQEILTTKFTHWSYEEEYRVFPQLNEHDKHGFYFLEFSPQLELKNVIVGHRSDVTRAEVEKALGNATKGVSMFKARLAFKTFEVVRQRRLDLW
jgi:hypothetical protein